MAEYNGVHNNFYDFPVTDPFSAVYKKNEGCPEWYDCWVPEMFEQIGYQTAVYLLNISGIIEIIFAYAMAFYKNSDENQGGSPAKRGKNPAKSGENLGFSDIASNFSRAILIFL